MFYNIKTSIHCEPRLRVHFVFILIILMGALPCFVNALPKEGKIVSGSGTINNDGVGNLTVNQTSDKIAINWQSFSIGNSESVIFLQPSISASALNNITGSLASLIQGSLTANGQVILTNPNGIHIDPAANIDVASLIASTLNISTQDFINNLYKFAQNPDQPLGFILNEGTIRASDFVAMISPGVENKGVVIANLGTASAVAGEEVTVDFIGDELINFSITKAVSGTVLDHDGNTISDQINNKGIIRANGGQVILTAASTSEIIKNVVNNEGIIQANTVVKKNGKILLMGGSQGVVRVSGTLDASGDDTGEKGGTTHVLGEKVALNRGSLVDVSGDTGGGEALIGGDYQGNNLMIQNAAMTYVDKEALINTSATTLGNGGKAIVWADDVNRFYGSVRSTGGINGGNGGFVEVSGKKFLDFKGSMNLSAHYGDIGTLLLDPTDVKITNVIPKGAVGEVDQFGDAGSVVKIDADTLDSANANITVQANNNIIVDEDIVLNMPGATLTLTAKNEIIVNNDITTSNGAITLTAGKDFISTGSIDSGSSSTTIALYNGGTIGLGSALCRGSCDMTISDSELQKITSTDLVIGGSNTGDVYVDNVATAATQNISGTVFINSSNNISFVQNASTIGKKLTLTSDGDISIESDLTVLGNFNATADDDGDLLGDFTLNSGLVLDVQGDSTLTANNLNLSGRAIVSGAESLNGNVNYGGGGAGAGPGAGAGMKDMMADMMMDSAFDSLFMGSMEGMMEGMMEAFGGGGPMKGGGC